MLVRVINPVAQRKLVIAIKQNDINLMREAFSEGAKVKNEYVYTASDAEEEDHKNSLDLAIKFGASQEVMAELIKKKAQFGDKAMVMAIQTYREIVPYLLEKGCRTNSTSIGIAISSGADLEFIRLLSRHGAEPDNNMVEMNTIQEAIACQVDPEIIRFLLQECEAKPNSKALYLLFSNQHYNEEMVQLVIRHETAQAGFFDRATRNIRNANQVNFVRFLLDHKVNPNANQGIALRNAADQESPQSQEVVDLLLQRGADPKILPNEYAKKQALITRRVELMKHELLQNNEMMNHVAKIMSHPEAVLMQKNSLSPDVKAKMAEYLTENNFRNEVGRDELGRSQAKFRRLQQGYAKLRPSVPADQPEPVEAIMVVGRNNHENQQG